MTTLGETNITAELVSINANITDNAIVRGDGGAKGIQQSGILIDDSDNITNLGTLNSNTLPTGPDTLVGRATTDTLTNKSINSANNTITNISWTGDGATGIDGQIPTFNSSGNPAFVSTGTSTQVLTSNGAGAAPTFQDAGGGGGWTELANVTLGSAASSISSGTFAAQANLQIRVYTEGLSASQKTAVRFNGDTGTNYDNRGTRNGSSSGFSNVSQTSMSLHYTGTVDGSITTLDLINVASYNKAFTGTYLQGLTATEYSGSLGGIWKNTADQITSVTVIGDAGGNLLTGSKLVVFGRD